MTVGVAVVVRDTLWVTETFAEAEGLAELDCESESDSVADRVGVGGGVIELVCDSESLGDVEPESEGESEGEWLSDGDEVGDGEGDDDSESVSLRSRDEDRDTSGDHDLDGLAVRDAVLDPLNSSLSESVGESNSLLAVMLSSSVNVELPVAMSVNVSVRVRFEVLVGVGVLTRVNDSVRSRVKVPDHDSVSRVFVGIPELLALPESTSSDLTIWISPLMLYGIACRCPNGTGSRSERASHCKTTS